MSIIRPALAFSLLVPVILSGCGKGSNPNASTPEMFLKWSMNQYHDAKAFNSDAAIKIDASFLNAHQTANRHIDYGTPNLYRVVTNVPKGASLTTASDGTKEVDFSSVANSAAASDKSPAHIWESGSTPLTSPQMGGSLLYQFFGGAENLPRLVKAASDPITWGPDGKSASGEDTKTVKFMGVGEFGHTEVTIGVTTGLVYQIKFDSAPLVLQMLRGQTPEAELDHIKTALPTLKAGPQHDALAKLVEQGPSAFTIQTVETYDHPQFQANPTAKAFDVTLPAGAKVAPPAPDGQPPVALGSPAPDFTVKDQHGKTFKLSSLKGHVVLVDFWATWCGPCRKGLPDTAAFAKLGEKKGLKVLAVSQEDLPTIAKFAAAQTYTVPMFNDPEGNANVAYHIQGIPTQLVIDSNGNLVDYLVGLHEPAEIANSLKKAGLDLGS